MAFIDTVKTKIRKKKNRNISGNLLPGHYQDISFNRNTRQCTIQNMVKNQFGKFLHINTTHCPLLLPTFLCVFLCIKSVWTKTVKHSSKYLHLYQYREDMDIFNKNKICQYNQSHWFYYMDKTFFKISCFVFHRRTHTGLEEYEGWVNDATTLLIKNAKQPH